MGDRRRGETGFTRRTRIVIGERESQHDGEPENRADDDHLGAPGAVAGVHEIENDERGLDGGDDESNDDIELTEKIPNGPTISLMQKLAKKHQMALVVPIYEVEMTGVYYNTAAVIDADGRYLGKYRKHHIPHCHPGFWEKFYFTPGNAGYPVFQTRFARVGVYICYDRHFPEGARCLGLNGAEIVYNPSATVAGLSEYLWELEQPAHAVANAYFVAAINRVGTEAPWKIGEFYGKSYFCDPRGKIVAQASRDKDELLVADLNLDEIQKVRDTWQFYRDRRPESYGEITRTRASESSEAAN